MPDAYSTLMAEMSAFLVAKDKREYLITRAEKFFDEVIVPIELPGPDQVIDPLLRTAIRPLVGRFYDELIQKMEGTVHA